MAVVSYAGKALIPGPFVTISREIVRNETGRIIRRLYNVSLKGKISSHKGSPNAAGTFWTTSGYPPDDVVSDDSRLAAILHKIEAIKNLFSCHPGEWLLIQPFDGSTPLRFQPRIRSMEFPDGGRNIEWYENADYTINMEVDSIAGLLAEECLIGDLIPDETWSIEATDEKLRAYRLTHVVSSQQKDMYDATGAIPVGNNGWERAQSIVLPHLGIDFTQAWAVGAINIVGWQAYNYTRSQQVDKANGRFAVTENWIIYDAGGGLLPPAYDDYTVISRVAEDGLVKTTIEGTIQGLEIRDVNTGSLLQTKWQSALAYFNTQIYPNVYNRVVLVTGQFINPIPLSSSISRNLVAGTITYNGEYDNRLLPAVPGAIREVIQVTDSGAEDVFATIPIPGRIAGPILQSIGTINAKTRVISIEAFMRSANLNTPVPTKPNTDGLVLSLAPTALQVFLAENSIGWSPNTGHYTRTAKFVYQ